MLIAGKKTRCLHLTADGFCLNEITVLAQRVRKVLRGNRKKQSKKKQRKINSHRLVFFAQLSGLRRILCIEDWSGRLTEGSVGGFSEEEAKSKVKQIRHEAKPGKGRFLQCNFQSKAFDKKQAHEMWNNRIGYGNLFRIFISHTSHRMKIFRVAAVFFKILAKA